MARRKKAASSDNRESEKVYRCKNHPDRYPDAVTGKCWECFLGRPAFERKFKMSPEKFYGKDGPGQTIPQD